jgi:hypothetical protein
MKTTAEKSYDLTSLFEAEVFVRLMLWRWEHPCADDEDFANGLLEDASNILHDAMSGVGPIGELPAADTNFVAAVWWAERNAVELGSADPEISPTILSGRKAWLSTVKKALPSCFCHPDDLEGS